MPDCANQSHVTTASNCVTVRIYFDQQLKAVAIIMFICVLCYLLCKKILEYFTITQTSQLFFSETIVQTKIASRHGFLFHSKTLFRFGGMSFLEMLEILLDPSESFLPFQIQQQLQKRFSISVCQLTKCKKALERHIYVYQMNSAPN